MKMAITITIFNEKGGVGKSTTASNLVAGLTLRKKRVCGIDIDPQGHLTKLSGVSTKDENTILEIFSGDATFEETVKKTDIGDIIPCDRNLLPYLKEFSADINNIYAVKELVEQIDSQYDFVIIDCPPNANQITTSALIASDYIIVPTEAEYLALDGVVQMASTFNSVKKRLNPNLKVLGVLLTRYQARRNLTKKVEQGLETLVEKYLDSKLFKAKINNSVAIPSSQNAKKSIYDYDKKSKVAVAYMEFVDEVIKGVK